MTSRLKVLIVTYAFPPRGGVAVQRVLSWVKHFPPLDIDTTVLTVTPPRGTVQSDASLLDRIPPSVRVIRTPSLEPYRLYRALGGKRAQDAPEQRATQVAGDSPKGGVGDAIYRTFQERWLVPDPKIGWFPFAIDAVKGLLEEGWVPDVILTTQPPASALVIGAAIGRLCDRPLVVDYRDPWTTGYYPLNRPLAVAARETALEQSILQQAAAITTVSGYFGQKLETTLLESAGNTEKIELIENGYEQDYEQILNLSAPLGKSIVHSGSLYAQRSPEPFLQAIASLYSSDPGLLDGWTIRWLGNVDPQYLRLAEALHVPITFEGYVSHAASRAAQSQADILLLFTEGMLTAKVYEYLQSRRPVVAIGDSEELDRMLRDWGVGACYRPSEAEGITNALRGLIAARNASSSPIVLELKRDLATIERGVLAGRMAALLRRVAAAAATPAAYTPQSHG